MIRLGLVLTAYFLISFFLFFITSNTIMGAIVYLFLLLPFCAALLLAWWIVALQNRTKTARINYRIWSVVLALQIATMLVAPGNCFGAKQGDRCYSNLQILVGSAPRSGSSSLVHWRFVEDSFYGLAAAYGAAVLVGVVTAHRSMHERDI
ncbi:MAG: hypothetical protein AAFY26_02380 [Cyanobacteria bacterium J06638_22]